MKPTTSDLLAFVCWPTWLHQPAALLSHSGSCLNNTQGRSYYTPFVFSAWCESSDGINICDEHCICVRLQGSSHWLCLRFSRWSLNGTVIDLGNEYRRHVSGGSLIIRDLDKDQDAGVYQCTAFNTWGSTLSRRASLRFACKWLHRCFRVLVQSWQKLFWHLFVCACISSCDLWGFVIASFSI